MAETIFRKGYKVEELNIEGKDCTYQFSAAPLFKSSLCKETSVIIVAKQNNDEKTSIDFMMSEKDFNRLINYLVESDIDSEELNIENDMNEGVSNVSYQFSITNNSSSLFTLVAKHNHRKKYTMEFTMTQKDRNNLIYYFDDVVDYINERNAIQDNLLNCFNDCKKAFKDGDIKRVEVELVNTRPFSNTEEGKKLQLMFMPKRTHTSKKEYPQFQAVTYITGVYSIDKDYLSKVLDDVPIVYMHRLVEYGKKYIAKRQKEALDQTEKRAVEMKKRWDTILAEHEKKKQTQSDPAISQMNNMLSEVNGKLKKDKK